MLKSHKRFIWFFGYWIMQKVCSYVYYITIGESRWEGLEPLTILGLTLILLAGWFIPMFIFKDDPVLKTKRRRR